MAFNPAPAPKSALGYYRLLSPTAAVRVSPICLGTMNFGEAWEDALGVTSQQTTEEILDYYYQQGGNFIDTANHYQRGKSEQWVGDWMKKRGNRDQMVLATKFTATYRSGLQGPDGEIIVNSAGNSAKSLRTSLNTSLKNLQTDYIDVLYVHWWDYTTSIPELMHALDDTVKSGKVLYLGISNCPAWVVSKANQYARDHGLRQFTIYQGLWNASARDIERDILPMCREEGMSVAPWGALGRGEFKTEEQRAKQASEKEGRVSEAPSEQLKAVINSLDTIAQRKNTALTSIALAYVMHKAPYVFPIIGGRKVEHLKHNIEALSVELTSEDIKEIESVGTFDLGFPMNVIGTAMGPNFLTDIAGKMEYVEERKPIPVRKS